MKTRMSLSLVAATAIATTLALASAPAGASTTHQARLMSRMTTHGVVTSSVSIGNSQDNAGYLAQAGTSNFSFEANVNVPTISCNPNITNPIFLYMIVNGTLPNGNPVASGVFTFLQCSGATPSYTVSVSVDGHGSPEFAVNPGDHLRITGAVAPHGEQYTVQDINKGASKTVTGAGLSGTTMQFNAQHGFSDNPYNFPPFLNYAFYNLMINNQPFSSAANLFAFNQVDSFNRVLVGTTQLNPAGKAFGMTYQTNQPPATT